MVTLLSPFGGIEQEKASQKHYVIAVGKNTGRRMKFLILAGIDSFETLGAHAARTAKDAISLIESLDDGTEPVDGEYSDLEKVLYGTIPQYLQTVYQGIQIAEARNEQGTEVIEGEFKDITDNLGEHDGVSQSTEEAIQEAPEV